jgi:hypothetical protein
MLRRIAGLAALLLAAATLPWAPARASLACPTSKPAVAVVIEAQAPTIDNTLPQPALQKLAGKAHHGGRAQGLYRAAFKTRWRAVIGRRSDAAETCRWINRVTVEIAVSDRMIYIIRERRPGGCPYDSVLAHERKHQAADDAVLAEYRTQLQRAAERAISALPPTAPVPLARGDKEETRLTAAIAKALQHGLDAMSAARAARQAAIDTPAEYRRVRAACG